MIRSRRPIPDHPLRSGGLALRGSTGFLLNLSQFPRNEVSIPLRLQCEFSCVPNKQLFTGFGTDNGLHEILDNQAVLEGNVSKGVDPGILHLNVERKVDNLLPDRVFRIGPKWECFVVAVACCHSRLPEEVQVMLILHILCGFGIDEVASAFVTTYTAVEKRIPRAKKVLAESKRLFDTQVRADFSARLPGVQRALYLLFNEGYHGASAEFAVRAELCQEAMRLAAFLLEHPLGATASSYALSALMCLNKARLPARLDASGKLNSLMRPFVERPTRIAHLHVTNREPPGLEQTVVWKLVEGVEKRILADPFRWR